MSALEEAVAAVEAHDVDALRAVLTAAPGVLALPVGRSANHLLDMATATCDERTVALLLEHGADVGAANVHGWTALHQAAYVGLPGLARLLLAAGAPADRSARGDGGTPLVVALFWGHRRTAAALVEPGGGGFTPRNLRVAAGLGDLALLDALVAPDGTLAPGAGAARAFHRPHSGFPAWTPSDDPAEIRDEALSWAARNDEADAITLLVERGAQAEADVHRGTALAWAAACGKRAAIERLLALGAGVNTRTSFGGPDHGEATTALHLAAQNGDRATVELLLAHGADPALEDAVHGGTPAGWAHFGGHAELSAFLAR